MMFTRFGFEIRMLFWEQQAAIHARFAL